MDKKGMFEGMMLEIRDNTAIVVLNCPSSLNILSSAIIHQLDKMLDQIEGNSTIKTLVIKSDKKNCFIAGADIKMIAQIDNDDEGRQLIIAGQEVLNKLASLSIPSVAVIDGACLGGGLELALACTWRIVSDNPQTQLGLPEVQLGVIPGFGGTYRLPKQVGLITALNMITTGKSITANKAYKIGLVDDCVPQERLNTFIADFVSNIINNSSSVLPRIGKKSVLERIFGGYKLICYLAHKKVYKHTKGFYPAPDYAIGVISKSYGQKIAVGLKLEQDNFIKLASGDVAKNLIQLFFTKTQLKKNANFDKKINATITDTAIVGTGFMGGSIAWLFTNHDYKVRLKDIKWQFVTAAYAQAANIYNKMLSKKKLQPHQAKLKMAKISSNLDYSGFAHQNLVIEAISEDLALKKKVFAQIETCVDKTCLIASNTSSLSITSLAADMQYPQRFIGIHFFSPVALMPLVEVIPHKLTDSKITQQATSFICSLGKIPVVVRDCSGFLVNRLLLPYVNEAMYLLQDGITIKQIDNIATIYGMPVGPLTLTDEVGWDIGLHVIKQLHKSYGNRMQICTIFEQMSKKFAHNLGRKSGSGFYNYTNKQTNKQKGINSKLVRYLNTKSGKKTIPRQDIVDRMMLIMINEAAWCMQEKVVATAAILDFAFIIGCGFPAFRGGLLRQADAIGLEKLVAKLNALSSIYGTRFTPAPLLLDMATKKLTFY